MIGDMEFRLPYWDWEHPSHRKIPGAYTTPNDSTNPLHNGTRFMSPTAELPDEDVGDDVMDAALTAGNFTDFGGTSSDSGIPEGAPHGSVHVDVNGDMGAFSTAGRDPIFYAHHSNIDKMWSDWNKGASTHTNPSDPAFLNLKWNFFDENKVWRSITAAQVLNHENQLRYTYGPSKFSEMLPCIFDWIVIKVDWRVDRPLRLASADQARLRQALDRNERVRLHINGLAIPINKSAMYRLYTNADAANADAGPGSRDYLGVFPVVLNDLENRHPAKRTTTVIVKARKQMVEYLLRGAAPLQLAFVERGAKGEARRAMPARARSVHFAVPQPED
jgi:polyphenol oxidase